MATFEKQNWEKKKKNFVFQGFTVCFPGPTLTLIFTLDVILYSLRARERARDTCVLPPGRQKKKINKKIKSKRNKEMSR